MSFAVRREVLEALFADEKWRKRWDKTQTTAERERIIFEFCKEKGIKVVQLKKKIV